MVILTFYTTQGAHVVSIEGTVVYGTVFDDTRYNQSAQRTATGAFRVYDTGNTIVNASILIKNVTYTYGELLRTWIREKAIFQLNTFTIITPSGIDLGLGKGVNIPLATFDSNSLKGVFKYSPPGNYKIKFPYTFVRS